MTDHHALIIDDNIESIEIMGQMLKGAGIPYTMVNHPKLLTYDDLGQVTLVFLDLDMPGMNGYEVFQLLRDAYHVDVPIVAYTVNTNEKATVRAAGFDGMIAKPVDASCFGDQLRHILMGKPVWDDC